MGMKLCLAVTYNLHLPDNGNVEQPFMFIGFYIFLFCKLPCSFAYFFPLSHLSFFSWFVAVLCIFWTLLIYWCMICKNLPVCASPVHFASDQFFILNILKYKMFSLQFVLSGSLQRNLSPPSRSKKIYFLYFLLQFLNFSFSKLQL